MGYMIVTGANSGIGFHLVSTLLSEGHHVAVLDLRGDHLTPLQEAHRGRLTFVPCDVGVEPQVSEAIDGICRAWGQVDVLINNACVCHFGPFETRTSEQRRRELQVNYFGYVNTIAAVLPTMKKQRRGIIYNVSSGIGLTGFAGASIYASAKGAIEALTRTLALELAPAGITVSLMHPPLTRTASATPLGVPPQAMADPAVVGRKLARRVGSKKPVITPDLATGLSLIFFRLFPTAIGRLLSRLTERARSTPAR